MITGHIVRAYTGNRKLLILFFGCFFLLNICLAQKNGKSAEFSQFKALNWDEDAGLLKSRWHLGMLKDKKGFMWVASEHGEISRFDGHLFKLIQPFKEKIDEGFSNCHKLLADSSGNLWFGTAGGLIKFDIQADTFIFVDSRRQKNGRFSIILPIAITSEEVICILDDSIVTYNPATHLYTKRFDLSGIEEWRKAQFSRNSALYDPKTSSVWLALGGEEGLLQLLPQQKKYKVHRRKFYKKSTDNYSHPDAESIVADPRRNCLWTNSHDGLYRFNLVDFSFQRISILDSVVSKDYYRWMGVDIDRDGNIWFTSDPLGIVAYDPDRNEIYRPLTDNLESRKVAEGNLKIYCDPEGMVWLSYWMSRGIYQLIHNNPSVKNYYPRPGLQDSLSGQVYHVMAADKGKLWLATSDGLNIFDPGTGKFEVLREKDFHGLKGNIIIPFAIDSIRNKYWVNAGPHDNIYAVDMDSRVCENIQLIDQSNNKVASGSINPIMTIPFQKGFLVLDNVLGIFYFDRDSLFARQVVQPLGSPLFQMVNIGDSIVTMFTPFLPNRHSTYALRNGAFVRIRHKADSIQWNKLIYDEADKSFWASVKGDIIHLSKDFNIIQKYERPGTLSNDIFSLIQADDRNIWIADDRGNIMMLNITNGQFTSLSKMDGYERQHFDWWSPVSVKFGKDLFFAGSFSPKFRNGLIRISPDRVRYPGSRVYVAGFKVHQKAFRLKEVSDTGYTVDLAYDQNQLSIETGIIDYFSQGKSSLRYKIDDSDSSWHYVPYYNTINFDELGLGKHTILLQASNAANEFDGPVKSIIINIHPAFWQTWWFRLPVALIILGTAYVFLRRSIRQKYRKRIERSEKERQIAELKQKSSELEMQALRAQMNPHFIFNSLNSINRFILQNNRLQASEFLTKFSRLIRLILQNSQAPYITLESELESLGLYLELESLRFDYRFAYNISVDERADVSTLLVPPLVIQPYVENAIWHGLMNKKESGRLDIEVSQEDKFVYVRVADNGVGRKQAAASASKSATKHKSMGLQITEHRIAMMHTGNGVESPVSINDLMNPDGTAAGTEVIIKIPEMYD